VTPEQLARVMAPRVREFTAKAVADALAPLMARNMALEARILELETRPDVIGPAGPMGSKGDTGATVATMTITSEGRLLALMTDGKSIDAGPVPVRHGLDGKDGAAGVNGKDGADGRHGIDGKPGADGMNGKDGAPGERGADAVDGAPGRDGIDGKDGKDGAPGRDGRDGAAGGPGANGKDGADGINGRDGADGLDGKDGSDGMGFDDFDLILDEQRGWILRLVKGERVKEWPVPMPFYRGPWEAGSTYPKSASVRWDGALWLALKATVEKPGEGCADWQLLVSRGKQGREGPKGPRGDDGKDLTQMDPNTGRKW